MSEKVRFWIKWGLTIIIIAQLSQIIALLMKIHNILDKIYMVM